MKQKTITGVVMLTSLCLLLAACGGNKTEEAEPTSTTNPFLEYEIPEEPTREELIARTEQIIESGESFHGPEDGIPIPDEVARRPSNMTAEEWWVKSGLMEWFSGDTDKVGIKTEKAIQIWSDPNNSDVGDPSFAQELVEAGAQMVVTTLTTDPPDAERFALPAENIVFDGGAAAKVYRPDGGDQLYRVAIIWSAEKDRVTRLPVFGRIYEMYFYGTPGNINFVSCVDVGENLCTPIFADLM